MLTTSIKAKQIMAYTKNSIHKNTIVLMRKSLNTILPLEEKNKNSLLKIKNLHNE